MEWRHERVNKAIGWVLLSFYMSINAIAIHMLAVIPGWIFSSFADNSSYTRF